jgi:cellulose synthase/poly-beta-1,6-N-acetylglucosamine synthase-like glycosyltransferase
MCIGSSVLAAYGWTAYSTCEDWELYALLTERGIPIRGMPRARIYAQEASTLAAGASQRRRWTGGKLGVLADRGWPLLRSRRVGIPAKLDALAELGRPGPVVHLCLVAAAIGLALVLRLPGALWLAGILLATLLRPAAYTIAAISRDPEPGRVIAAFAFLPLYAAWRAWTVVTTLASLGDKAWVRTARPSRTELSHHP